MQKKRKLFAQTKEQVMTERKTPKGQTSKRWKKLQLESESENHLESESGTETIWKVKVKLRSSRKVKLP